MSGSTDPLDGVDEALGTPQLEYVDAVELLASEPAEPKFLVEPLVPVGALVLLSGDTGAGKTALALCLAVAIAFGEPALGRFATTAGRVLYANGEMGGTVLTRYLREAVAGRKLPADSIFFEGRDGFATFRRRYETCAAFESLVEQLRPSLVIFDTARALLTEDENNVRDVNATFGWLRDLSERSGAAILVAHHLRKIGSVSNSARQRVSGSGALTSSIDVHLALRNREGRALHALVLDKTRTPIVGAVNSTTWPIAASLTPGKASTFIAAEPEAAADTGTSLEDARDEILALLELSDKAKTVAELGAGKGSLKRAFEALRKSGEIVEAGKVGRQKLFSLPGVNCAPEIPAS